MKIFVNVNGAQIERELSDTELMEAWVEQQHLFDIDYIEGMFGADERFDGMCEDEKSEALSDIAWRYDKKISGLDDPDKFEVASAAVEDYFEEREKQKGSEDMAKLESLIGYAGAKDIVEGFRFCGDWERDQINLSNTLQRHYYDDVGVYNDGIQKAIEDKVNRVIMEKYPDKNFVVDRNGVMFENEEKSSGRFEIEVMIDVVGGDGKELCLKMAGNDLGALKAGILPAVQKACAEQGYLDNQIVVGMLVEENGEWLDSDEETFDLSELNVWICSYKDSLGYIDNDNVTEILVPKPWLLEKLKAEGETDFDGWYDEYTADNTDMIARFAVSEGVVLSCTDKRISCVLGLGESFLRINDYGKRLAEHIREIYKAEYDKGEYLHEGTDIITDIFVSTPEDAAGWCLLTYGDRALGEVQEWIGEREAAGFGETTVFGFDIYDVRNILDKCVVPIKDSSLEVRLADASQRSCDGPGDLVPGVRDDMCK